MKKKILVCQIIGPAAAGSAGPVTPVTVEKGSLGECYSNHIITRISIQTDELLLLVFHHPLTLSFEV